MMAIFLTTLFITQAGGEKPAQAADGGLQAVFDRAAKEPDLDGAGLVLSSLLGDEAKLRAAFLTTTVLDERSVYILFEGDWGSRANVEWKDRLVVQRIRQESVSVKPALMRSVLRADRYSNYEEARHPRGTATINVFPFFSHSPYADDLIECYIESMRKETTHPAKPIKSPYSGLGKNDIILVTAEDMEMNLLENWRMLCGVCDRLDLIQNATTKNWRERFPELEQWFHKNRPYMVWDDDKSCVRIDEKAKEQARPTKRKDRSIPELKPPWLPADEPKEAAPRP